MSWTRSMDVPPLTESEYREVQSIFDTFLVGGQHTDTLHLHECRNIKRNYATSITEKPTATYPYGYTGVCEFCRHDWRNDDIQR